MENLVQPFVPHAHAQKVLTQCPSFDLLFQGQDETIRMVLSRHQNEGGDKVWGAPIAHKPHPLPWGDRPQGVPEHRVIKRLTPLCQGDPSALYANDQGPFLFVGYGEGHDYRTDKRSLEKIAQTGITVIGVNLATSLHARLDLKGLASPVKRATFFHLDTIFRPTPWGAICYKPAIPAETLEILQVLYGEDQLLGISSDRALAFGANGRLLKNSFGEQCLFYPEGGLHEEDLKLLAYPQKAELRGILKTDPQGEAYRVHELIKDGVCLLRCIPLPTSQALKGGGSVSCLTQLVPHESGLRIWVRPPSPHFGAGKGLNHFAREALKSYQHDVAKREFLSFKDRLAEAGFTVVTQPPSRLQDAIYTRDACDTLLHRNGKGFDPAQTPFQPGDQVMTFLSTFRFEERKAETLLISQEFLRGLRG